MKLIFNETILTEGIYKGQRALSVWMYDKKYFDELERKKIAKVFIFPHYIKGTSDIIKIQNENRLNWKGSYPYKKTQIFKYWKSMLRKYRKYLALSSVITFDF